MNLVELLTQVGLLLLIITLPVVFLALVNVESERTMTDKIEAPDTLVNMTNITNTSHLLKMIEIELYDGELPEAIDLNEAFQLSMIAKVVIDTVKESQHGY